MAFIFHKKPILYSAKTLSTLLDKFRAYTEEVSPTGDENNQYEELTTAGNRKELVSEVEEIDNETHFNEEIASANDMVYVGQTRLTETRSKAYQVAQKLGIDPQKSEVNTSTRSETSSSKGH
ncbi:hypothetical protein Aduo_017555 [Ancylostoma duodenale]